MPRFRLLGRSAQDGAERGSLHGSLRKYGLVVALLIICTVLAIHNPRILRPDYALTLLRQISINGILAVGVTFVLLTGGVDLSLGSLVALTGVVAALAAQGGHGVFLAVAAGLAAGVACGAVNGVIVTKGRVAPFIVTLGMMTAARGLAYKVSTGRPVRIENPSFLQISEGSLLGIPIPILLLAAGATASAILLSQTRTGRHLYATGGNEAAARASGINVHVIKILAYTLSGAFAALAGIMQAARISTGQPNVGVMYELDAIAAVVIGGTSLSGGVGGIGGTLLGALLMGVISSGLDLLNVQPYYQQIVKGVIIVGAVWLDRRGKAGE